jgi:hypothetical protein
VRSLIHFLQTELRPVIGSVSETANTIKGTTAFMSNQVVSPVLRIAGIAAGVRQAAQVIRRQPDKRRGTAKTKK